MRNRSLKRQKLDRHAEPIRRDLISEVCRCEWCGRHSIQVCVHEILRGGYRAKTLSERCAVLVLCDECHNLMGGREWAEQLAILRRSRPHDYRLSAFHALAQRVKPDESEVRLWSQRIHPLAR